MEENLTDKYLVRYMARSDLKQVLVIENDCYHPSLAWEEDDFYLYLRAVKNTIRIIEDSKTHEIVGYIAFSRTNSSYKIDSIAVKKSHRRIGIGSKLVNDLKQKLNRDRTRSRLTAVVRESCLSAQLFFRSMKFEAVEVKHNFYADPVEDGYALKFEKGKSDGQTEQKVPACETDQ